MLTSKRLTNLTALFARAYRDRFGEPPADTLNRGRTAPSHR